MRALAWMAVLVGAVAIGGAGCKAKGDPAACKTSAKDSDACKSCCSGAGMSGHMWNGMSNECTCL